MNSKILSVLAATAILCASCGDDKPDITDDGRVQFSSGINAVETKVGGGNSEDGWDIGDPVGIYMIGHSDGNIKDNAQNIRHTNTTQGKTAYFSSDQPIYYPVSGEKVDFMAYHPHSTSVNNYVYPLDLSIQNPQTALDFMVSRADNAGAGYDKTYRQRVDLAFDRQLTKISMDITATGGVNLDGLVVNIKGMNTTADFNLKDNTISNEGGNSTGITPFNKQGTMKYDAILLPVTFDDSHIVEFSTSDGNTYTWLMKENRSNIKSLEKGTRYTFTITVQRYKLDAMGKINSWKVGQMSAGVAE